MKYIVVLGDGMADRADAATNGATPLEQAHMPETDRLASMSEIGLVQTVPEGMAPGSDTANLSVLGYDPKRYYTGRSPLEALSIGVALKDTDVAIRCNLVSITEDADSYEEQVVYDHSSGEINTEDAAVLMDAVREALETPEFRFYNGVSYRHLLVWDQGTVVPLTGPHDIPGSVIGPYLPKEEKLRELMRKSHDVLKDHPINLARKAAGKNPANSIWFWGAGTKPMLPAYDATYQKKGAMISAVDLLKGIAVGADMKVVDVPGANGGLNTNYAGKADAACKVLLEEGYDFVYVHIEAPDEMGHQGNLAHKIESLERIDRDVIGRIVRCMDESKEPYRLMFLPDHPTPISVRTHTSDPVPYLLYDSRKQKSRMWTYNEKDAQESGIFYPSGPALMEHFYGDL